MFSLVKCGGSVHKYGGQAYADVERHISGLLVPRPLRCSGVDGNDEQAAGLYAITIECEGHEEEEDADEEGEHPSQERVVHALHKRVLLRVARVVHDQRVPAVRVI